MRRLFLLCLMLGACDPEQPAPREQPRIFASPSGGEDVFWDHPDAQPWNDRPMIVVAPTEGLYPDLPDFDFSLTCREDGRVVLGGRATEFPLDIGYIPLPRTIGLRGRDVSIDAAPEWENDGFAARGFVVLSPRKGQLRKLLTSGPLSLTYSGEGRGYAVTYPDPPRDIAETFLRKCGV